MLKGEQRERRQCCLFLMPDATFQFISKWENWVSNLLLISKWGSIVYIWYVNYETPFSFLLPLVYLLREQPSILLYTTYSIELNLWLTNMYIWLVPFKMIPCRPNDDLFSLTSQNDTLPTEWWFVKLNLLTKNDFISFNYLLKRYPDDQWFVMNYLSFTLFHYILLYNTECCFSYQ